MTAPVDLPYPPSRMRGLARYFAIRDTPTWLAGLVVIALWLLVRPYTGVRHDGVLYTGQVLLHLHPDIFAHDLFFAFGSQDQFSVFARLVAWLYSAWGMATGQILILAVCHGAFMALLLWTLRSIEPAGLRWAGLAVVAALSHLYGAKGVFAFAETFVTARTLAEPLALAAVVALLSGRVVVSAALLVCSALAHPLVAIPAMAVCWAFLCLSDRRWLWAASLLLVPIVLGLLGLEPFARLFIQFDPPWWRSVSEANGHVLLANWRLSDWQIAALDAGLLLLAAQCVSEPLARFARALLLAGVGLLGLTAYGADLSHNVLLTGLQFFRVMWLVHLFALALLPAVLWRQWHRFGGSRTAALALATAVLAVNANWAAGWVFIAWAAAMHGLSGRPGRISARFDRAASVATLVAMAGLTAAALAQTISEFRAHDATLDFRTLLLVALSVPTLSLPAAALLLYARPRRPAWPAVAAAATIAIAAYGASQWDRRDDWTRFLEASIGQEHPFDSMIPPRAQVYWPDDQMASWILLKRASFVTGLQSAGVLFNRGTAIEYERRVPAMAVLQMQRTLCALMQGLDEGGEAPDCSPSPQLLAEICRLDPGPDFLVLKYRVPPGVVAEWAFRSATRPQTYYLYDCLKLR